MQTGIYTFNPFSIVNCHVKRKFAISKQFDIIRDNKKSFLKITTAIKMGDEAKMTAIPDKAIAINPLTGYSVPSVKNPPIIPVHQISTINANAIMTEAQIFMNIIFHFAIPDNKTFFNVSFCSSVCSNTTNDIINKHGITKKFPKSIFKPTRFL